MKGKLRLLAGGAAVGAANGLFGGGGGMIAVPLLERAADLSAARAHATAIALILPTSLAGGVVYLLCGLVPFAVLVPVAVGVIAGGVLGAELLPLFPPLFLEVLFAALMLAAGAGMLF